MSGRGVLRIVEGGRLSFWCPACKHAHGLRVTTGRDDWKFNGNYDRPTFQPSVLVTWRAFSDEGERRYQEWLAQGCPPLTPSYWSPFHTKEMRCHSYVRDGRIQYLADCTHEFAGKTVPLEAF